MCDLLASPQMLRALLRPPKIFVVIGLLLLLIGALDPLEGSIAVVIGTGLAAFGAWREESPYQRLQFWAFGLVLFGVAALFALSAVGGVGGNSGRSVWWLLPVVSYPIGWVMSLTAMGRVLGRSFRA